MTILPIHVARVPSLLGSRLAVSNLNRTNLDLLELQTQISTGRQINRTSDNPVRASGIAVLNSRIAAGRQYASNLSHAGAVLDQLDQAFLSNSGLTAQVRLAQDIASGQIDSDDGIRRQQATVVNSIISSIFQTANGDLGGVYYFGGSTPNQPPIVEQNGGYRYVARGSGLRTELGLEEDIPITIGGDNAVGEASARLRSTLDLDPDLTGASNLSDLAGARGLGVTSGDLQFQLGVGPVATVNLSQARTAQDVATRLTAAIRQYETDNSVTVLGPAGISFAGGGFSIDVAPGASLTFTDQTGATTAADLGLAAAPFTTASPAGLDLSPRLTLQTPLSAISSLTPPLGSIRLRLSSTIGSTLRDVDLSSAATIDDVRNLIESTGLGIRVTVNQDGTAIDIQNEISGRTLAIEEIAGGVNTASQLGIRSLDLTTTTADFNAGRGVRIVDGRSDPVTGAITPALNADLRITLGNGNTFDVDLRPQDLATVQTVLDRINTEATAAETAGQIPAGSFSAALTDGANGIAFRDLTALGPIKVEKLNNSAAAQDLGLLDGAYDAPSATFVAQDRAAIRVNNVFSDLIDLRDALLTNDRDGIVLAGERLGQSADRVLAAHALVAAYGARARAATDQQADKELVNISLKSDLEDLDLTDAAVRFSQLQTQLSASLQSAAALQQLSLLDFLR